MKYSLTLEGSREEIDRALGLLWGMEPKPQPTAPVVGQPRLITNTDLDLKPVPFAGSMPGRVADDTKHTEIIQAGKAAVAAHPEREMAVPTVEQLETAVKAYMKDKGIPQARKLLDEYTSGQVSSVPVSQRAELLARLTA